MVKTFQAYLPNCHRTYSCIHCRAHLANHDELISKSFQGSQGRAYLFNSVVNVGCGPAEERVLLTGLHAVADIYCECCKTTLGWKYEHAFESSQKYKEGKFIIELAHMIKENGWDWDLARPGPSRHHVHHLCCAATGSCDGWQMGRNGPPGALWGVGSGNCILLNILLTRCQFRGMDFFILRKR